MTTNKSDALNLPFFCGLNAEEILFLKGFLTEKTYQEGEVIIKQGSHVKNLILIQEGLVSISVFLPGCKEKVIAHLKSKHLIGDVAFFSNSLATATVIAEHQCKCLIFPHDVLNMLRIVRPDIAFKVEQEISNLLASKITDNINMIIRIYTRIEKGDYQSNLISGIKKGICSQVLSSDDLNLKRIKKINFFSELEEESIKMVLSYMKIKAYPKGFLFGIDNTRKVIVIYSGAVLYFINKESFKKIIAVLSIGDLFIDGLPDENLAKIIAFATYEKTVTLEIDFETLTQLQVDHPKIFYLINKYMNKMIANSVYIINRQLIRINCEYNNIL